MEKFIVQLRKKKKANLDDRYWRKIRFHTYYIWSSKDSTWERVNEELKRKGGWG